MKRALSLILVLAMALGLLAGCVPPQDPTTAPTVPTTAPTEPLHSSLYREGLDIEQVLTYFQEVCNQLEYTDGTSDPALTKKWLTPLVYRIHGEPTAEDLSVLADFCERLNAVPGFPGIREAQEDEAENLTLSCLDQESFRAQFSECVQGEDAWGACQFWYWTDTNELYDARIGYRTDIPQLERSSILLEEIVNSIGITDTLRRSDSIVYQDSNENLQPSVVDWLILKLLYHPDIQCGMDAQQCEQIIRELYY